MGLSLEKWGEERKRRQIDEIAEAEIKGDFETVEKIGAEMKADKIAQSNDDDDFWAEVGEQFFDEEKD